MKEKAMELNVLNIMNSNKDILYLTKELRVINSSKNDESKMPRTSELIIGYSHNGVTKKLKLIAKNTTEISCHHVGINTLKPKTVGIYCLVACCKDEPKNIQINKVPMIARINKLI